MPDFEIERRLWARGLGHIAGLDEAGRGCLAGPVVAGAVVLLPDVELPGLDDSKKLTPARREALLGLIQERALGVGVGLCSPEEIDRMNILQAALEAMRRAVEHLSIEAHALLVDGNQALPSPGVPQETVVKGDARSLSIAAASVVAKVSRDRIMETLHEDYPAYGWAQHKGYPTAAHYAALRAHGPSPHHRRSFRLR